jgi:predicted O-methyltransferase YrrM
VLHRLTIDEPSKGFFDIAFIDADKENYRQYAELSMKLLRKGGLLIVDNTLWKGLVQYKESRDNSAEHIKALNEWVFETFGKNASLLPAWDGVTIVVKSE